MRRRIESLVPVLTLLLLASACKSEPEERSEAGAIAEESPAVATAAAAIVEPTPPELVTAPQHQPTGDVEFRAALDLQQAGTGLEPRLRHGRVAKTADWPASLYTTFSTPDGTAACTATLIGPQVMLTAGHCVPTSGGVRFKYEKQPPYIAACTQHPQYVSRQDPSADYALCKLDRPLKVPTTGFKFETVDTSAMSGRLGESIILTGFGCVSDIVATSSADGKYRIGTNVVDDTSASTEQGRGPSYYAPAQDNNLFTKDDPELANLCPGDSGGPAFRRSGGPEQFADRTIVGVNSRVFYTDATRTQYGASLISATGGPDFRAWAQKWVQDNSLAACGLNGNLPNCRH